MSEETIHPRFLRPRIVEALADSPVVLLHGPRQCGKTTLARLVGDEAGFAYFTFDDDVQRAAAQTDPIGYVADLPERAVLERCSGYRNCLPRSRLRWIPAGCPVASS